MRPFVTYLALIAFCINSSVLAQIKSEKDLKIYNNFFELNRESVYLHLNKNKFISGESIFFKAYLLDQKDDIPVDRDTNLYVGLYNSDGEQLQKAMWQVVNGVAYGDLKIDSNYDHGSYYVKASTNWMKNFDNPDPFLQKIQIVKYEFQDQAVENNNDFSVRLVPEGGQLISGILNTIGFQIIDSKGLGSAIDNGQVLDSLGNVVLNNIKSNAFGIGKFDLMLNRVDVYTCRFQLKNGQILYKIIPNAKDYGYTINITGGNENRIVSIRTNDLTFKKAKNRKLNLAIHRNGRVKLFPIKLDAPNKTLIFNELNLFPGVNIMSLLDPNFNLLAERILFNHHGMKNNTIQAKIVVFDQNSDTVRLGLRSENNIKDVIKLSVSVAPDDSDINAGNMSLFESIVLKPYLDRFAEISPYYFNDPRRETLFNLDLLLQIHGQSNFSWDNVENNTPLKKFESQNGITIRGTVTNKKLEKIKSIAIYQNQIEQMKMADIKKDGAFMIKNAVVIKNEPIFFILMNHKDQMEKPEIEVSFYPKMVQDSIIFSEEPEAKDILKEDQQVRLDLRQMIDQTSIALDNVTVIAKVPEKELKRNSKLKVGFWNGVKISEKELNRYPNISTYIRSLGFKVIAHAINNTLTVNAKSMSPFTKPPVIYLDGFRLNEQLRDFPLSLIDEIYYEHAGLMESNGGTIYIYRQEGRVANHRPNTSFTSVLAEEGFQKPSKFVGLIDSENMNELFKKYVCVFWEPNVIIADNKELEISFPRLGLSRFKILIEGISNEGALFSEEKIIEIRQE